MSTPRMAAAHAAPAERAVARSGHMCPPPGRAGADCEYASSFAVMAPGPTEAGRVAHHRGPHAAAPSKASNALGGPLGTRRSKPSMPPTAEHPSAQQHGIPHCTKTILREKRRMAFSISVRRDSSFLIWAW